MFTATIKYTDQETEVNEFPTYDKAVNYCRNELEWENTLQATVTNQVDYPLFKEKGSFH